MADAWADFNREPASSTTPQPSPAGGADPWAEFGREPGIERSMGYQGGAAESPAPPIPQPFMDRVAAGEALKQSYEQMAAKPYSQRLSEWSAQKFREGNAPAFALGGGAAFVAGIPEAAAHFAKLGYDAFTGKLLSGAGLRKEDFSDDPNGPQPLDALIQRSWEGAGVYAGGDAFSKAPPLLHLPDGQVARAVTDIGGTTRAQVVGPLPIPQDFANAAQVVVRQAEQNRGLALPTDMKGVRLTSEEAALKAQDSELSAKLESLPKGNQESADRLTRLQAVESDIGKATDRDQLKALNDRRDQILTNTNPETLRQEAAPFEQERALKAQRDSIAARLDEIDKERASLPKGQYQAEPARITPERVQANLERYWQEQGITPFELAHDAQTDAFLAHDLSSAAAHPTDLPPLISPELQPLTPAGKIVTDLKEAGKAAFDVGRWIQRGLAPISVGPDHAVSYTVKYLSGLRKIAWDAARHDKWITDNFPRESQEAIYRAMSEENELRHANQQNPNMGLATLEPKERALAEFLIDRSLRLRLHQMDRGMVQGPGQEVYAPRVFSGIGKEPISLGPAARLRERTGSMIQRKHLTDEESEAAAQAKYGPQVKLVRNVRVIVSTLAKQEKAIAAHDYMEGIREYGLAIGDPQVLEGDMRVPKGEEGKWFTVPESDLTKWRFSRDEDGNTFATKVPLHIKEEWSGPIKAIKDIQMNDWDKFIVNIKNRPMTMIMNSPFLHDTVIFSKAMASHPGLTISFRFLRQGGNLLNDQSFMHSMLDAGYVPWGRRPMLNQDVTSIAEGAQIEPGRSIGAKAIGYFPGLFKKEAGDAVKRGIDAMGELLHDKLLGGFINRLQASIAYDRQQSILKKFPNADPHAVNVLAAHEANRFAGSIPPEAMSAFSRGLANTMMFSRQWTLGNLGILKDAIALPKYVSARVNTILGPENAGLAKSLMKESSRHMAGAILTDFAIYYGLNAVLQSGVEMASGTSMSDEAAGYWWRLKQAVNRVESAPLNPMSYLTFLPSMSPTFYHEPGMEGKILLGYRPDGTAIYGRSVLGRMGEDYLGLFNPFQWALRKAAPLPRALMEVVNNQDSFGRNIYDQHPFENGDVLWSMMQVAKHLMEAELPMQQIKSADNLLTGQGDYKDALGVVGPFFPPPATITPSQGFPGGPKAGVLSRHKQNEKFEQDLAISSIREMYKRGDSVEARQRMNELGFPKGFQRWIQMTTRDPSLRGTNPRAIREFYEHASPRMIELMEGMGNQGGTQ